MKQLVKESRECVIAPPFCDFGDPFRNTLYPPAAFGVSCGSKQHPIQSFEYGRQFGVRVNVRLTVYSLPSNELVPVITAIFVHVEFALRQPVSRLGARSGSRAANDFPYAHDPVFIVVHFKNKHGRPGAGSADPNVGRRAINTPGVTVSASPVYIFSPG